MADFDFLDGFDMGGDWGFTGVSTKPSDQTVADTKATQQVVQQTADGVGKAVSSEIISRLETKLDKLNERKAKAKLEKLWGVTLYENPDYYHADWQAMREEEHLALVEYKNSTKSKEEITQLGFEGFRINTNKLQFAFPIVQLTRKDFYLIVEFPEGMMQHKIIPDAKCYKMTRFFKGRSSGKDKQPAYLIPWNLFEEVRGNEFEA